ncbi:iron-dicitrate transporter substrate-binding subunit [compost metagenome]
MADASSPYPQVGLEQVIKANPGLILAGSRDPAVLDHWRQWSMLDAVKQQRLLLINPDELHRFTPRALNAVEQLCEAIEVAHTGKRADRQTNHVQDGR